jgi:hypothetical protein
VVLIPVLSFFIFKQDKKSLGLFLANLLFSFIAAMTVLALGTARYSGFIFIGFIATLWLYNIKYPLTAWKKMLVNAMLVIHVAAGIFAVVKDVRLPFSNSYKVQELLQQVPKDKKLVVDYWALNTYASFIDQPVYALDLQKECFFVLLDNHMYWVHSKKNRYVDGLINLYHRAGVLEVYMISTHSPATIDKIDPQLQRQYNVELIDKREGAIEKAGNIYLYHILFSANRE